MCGTGLPYTWASWHESLTTQGTSDICFGLADVWQAGLKSRLLSVRHSHKKKKEKSSLPAYRPTPWLGHREWATFKECSMHQVCYVSLLHQNQSTQHVTDSVQAGFGGLTKITDSRCNGCSKFDVHQIHRVGYAWPTHYKHTHFCSESLGMKYKIIIHHRVLQPKLPLPQSHTEMPIPEWAGSGRNDFPYKNTELYDESLILLLQKLWRPAEVVFKTTSPPTGQCMLQQDLIKSGPEIILAITNS